MEKMKQRIVFVEPKGSDANVFARYMNLPLLGPVYMATILKKKGYNVQVYNEHMLGRKVNRKELNADVLCITGLTSTIERGYEIAKRFKSINPFGKVIIGGIHASFMKEEAARYADHVVIGEGETVIAEIIENIEKFSKEKFIYAQRPDDLDHLPVIDFSLLKNHNQMNITPVMTSRGCPFACNFCAVTAMYGRKYRTRNVDNVMDDLKGVRTKGIFFYDDNLCVNKNRSYEMFDKMKKAGLNHDWYAQVRCDAARDDVLLKKMADSGCHRVYIGFESINPATLKSMQKSQTPKDIKKAIKKFHEYGIKVHGMFIFGSDDDTKDVFRMTSDFCDDYEIDTVQYGLLTPLPGTHTFREMEKNDRLLHRRWKYYDAMHTVFKPKNFSPMELQNSMIECYKDFYSYTKAANDGLNLVYDTAMKIANNSATRVRNYVTSNFKTTLGGRIILHQWLKSNNHYLKYLQRLGKTF